MPVIQQEKMDRRNNEILMIHELEFNFKSQTMNDISSKHLVKLSSNSNNIPSKENNDQDDIESMSSDKFIEKFNCSTS